jgi:hypothetical protein
MKRKLLWIVALFAAFALLVTGCPTGGGDDDDDGKENGGDGVNLAEIFSATVLNGEKAVITLGKDTITAVAGTSTSRFDADLLTGATGFDASAYKGIKFEYKTTQQANVGLQDSGDSSSMWLITDWGAFTESNWTSVECEFTKDLMKAWGSSTAFDKSKWEKLWIGCDNPTSETKFEIRNFAFIK